MSSSSCLPPTPPPMGKGAASNVHLESLRDEYARQAPESRLANLAIQRRGIHKLMRSGTPIGNVVTTLYRVIWDFTYR